MYITVGTSMLPLLRQRRDIVEIRAKGSERFKKYDVVLYKRGSKYILHRIIKVRPNDYVIVGDHNITLEYGITDEQILGKMVRVIRDGHEITPDNKLYKLYAHLWCDFYPVRVFILRGRAAISRRLPAGLKKKIKNLLKHIKAKR